MNSDRLMLNKSTKTTISLAQGWWPTIGVVIDNVFTALPLELRTSSDQEPLSIQIISRAAQLYQLDHQTVSTPKGHAQTFLSALVSSIADSLSQYLQYHRSITIGGLAFTDTYLSTQHLISLTFGRSLHRLYLQSAELRHA